MTFEEQLDQYLTKEGFNEKSFIGDWEDVCGFINKYYLDKQRVEEIIIKINMIPIKGEPYLNVNTLLERLKLGAYRE